jgi:hypothetical protein
VVRKVGEVPRIRILKSEMRGELFMAVPGHCSIISQ